ncbi:LANO_0D05050g1_1 [Lachancea nothofagi CBS 11611]|uniref:LANO_0D05050g1_1 n=1 Tax=Lachancea nothofagi CBS 11611 TaxID=1266666 RepID=A0A1G4JH39_9SACH|nr:LANO_0D05050g1_1 [Lachancea nothofagi CBS 11611]
MFNSFLTQIGQRQMSNVLNTFNPAAHGMGAAIGSAINQPAQRFFHAAMNTPSMLEMTHPTTMQATPQFQVQVPPPVVKKMSASQSRIEKRKLLKKQGPKRPSSAYFLFSMAAREDLVRQYPDAKVPELSKLASAKWKEMTDEDKKPFHEKFKVNWEKYRIARKEYESHLPPKRPSGPFIQFTQEVRPKIISENPEKDLIEITKLIGEKWRSLSQPDKQSYTDTYKRKLKEWEEQYPEETNPIDAPKIESLT